eukprot:CAMPEP_0115861386 /NCGR_PEP_ID=MMETSP0287-20121206/17626_1 /TAXON_ID=412157 /ORGANISM="Chrysochromulina rotalis, Strain UIO044" /LENGTH=87 /DNA_ID=CAMNT_0003315759 /DNA_START=50 /DNA_END=313 /DNA_ORIENTATION=+
MSSFPRDYVGMSADDPVVVAKQQAVDPKAYRERHGFPSEGGILPTEWNQTLQKDRIKREADNKAYKKMYLEHLAKTNPALVGKSTAD